MQCPLGAFAHHSLRQARLRHNLRLFPTVQTVRAFAVRCRQEIGIGFIFAPWDISIVCSAAELATSGFAVPVDDMDPEDNDRETENGQWNYLDGTPARLNEDVGRGTSLLEQTVSDVVHMLNPFSWFRKKPSRPNSQQVGQQRRPINAERNWNASSRRPLNSHNVVSNQDERPAKRHRPGFSSELDYADAGLPRGTQGSIDEEMPPNVEFTADERPTAQPSSSKSYNDMMTDDEDDDQPSRPSTSNNRNSIFTLNRPNQPSKFFASSAAKSEANARRSMPVQSPERKTTLLPLIETHNLNRSTLRNPLMEQTKLSPMMTPTPSRKRGFDAVDRDERGEVPKLFSMFPKTSERTTVLSRFGSPAKFGEESNKKTSQPLYAMKRLETLKNGDFTQSRDARTTSLSPFKALPSLNRNTNTVDSPSKLMNNSISRKTAPVKLDYSYVIQSPSPTSSRGQFAFVAAVTVPNGELAKAVKAATRDDRESSVVSGSTEMNTSARLCNKCGISVKADGGNKCEVCERLKSPGKKVVDGEKDDEPMEVRKPSTSRAKENTAQNEVWSCDLCGENNREETSCKSCGKSRKSTKASPSESAKQDSSPKRAPLSSPTPNEQSKEDEKSAPSAKPKETSSTPQSSAPNKPPSTSAAGSSAPVNDLWSKLGQAKQWTCSECWTGNDDQKTQCAACGKAKPGTEQNTTATTAPAKPAFSFGGPQADPPAKPASTIPPATGFSFGGAQPASNASKPASDAPAVSSNLFGFGNPSAPKLAAPSTGSTSGGFSGFSGFGNLPVGAATASSDLTTTAPATVTAAPSVTTDKPPGTFAFGAMPATTSAGLPALTGFGLPSFPTAASGTVAPSIFAGFASGSGASAPAQPTGPSTTGGLKGFGFELPSAAAATTGDNVVKPAAAAGMDFQFGAAPASGASAFAGFGAPNAAGTTSLFGQQNGLAPQTNGLPQPSATAAPFTFSSGIPTFGAATAGLQNGGAVSQIPAPGFMGAPAGTAPNGTFGSATATIGGSVGPQRRVLVPKRRLNPR